MAYGESVCIIVFDEKENVLLIKRRDIPVWVLPGGGIDPGETPEDAALREAEEELGAPAVLVRKIAEYLPVNKMTRLTHFFEAKLKKTPFKEGSETLDLSYFPKNKLPIMPPPYADWIEDALKKSPDLIRKKIVGVSYGVLFKLLLQHPLLVGRYLLTKLGIHWNS